MSSNGRPSSNGDTGLSNQEAELAQDFAPERELVVIAKPEAGLRAEGDGVTSSSGEDTSELNQLLADEQITLRPLFGQSEESHDASGSSEEGVPDLSVFYRVDAPDDRLDELASRLRELAQVEAAYVKPPAELPVATSGSAQATQLNDMVAATEDAPAATPSFVQNQTYLNVAPGGIDAVYAATQPGGTGAGVRIIDIEGAWRFTHEDLVQNQGGVVGGTPTSDLHWRNHGTAVIGEFGGDVNQIGITGICPDANVRAVSIFGGTGSAGAIRQAADALGAGDIILIELHRPGPEATGAGQQGFIAIEWWPDDFAAIRYAISRGVIVVEAAGNGAVDLDAPIYDQNPGPPLGPFPSGWSNPFRRGAADSGAILVGAGAPPPGTHGADWGPDRSRLDFSNWGAAVDAQGWGREVTTCGYGDLQGGSNEDRWYTDRFSGTSSASPIVVGALGCVQGALRARSKAPFSPAQARNLLRTTGSVQQDAPGRPRTQRIGNRPDLRQMLPQALGAAIVESVFTHNADLTGDGRADIVGFGNDFVWVSLNNGDGTFKPIKKAIDNFAYNAGGWRVEKHPRFLADLTGDKCADIIGFGNEFVWVSLNDGNGAFKPIKKVIDNFAYNAGGWRVEKHPRFLADINGDGRADIIGFGNDFVWVSLNNGDGTFQPIKKAIDNFAYNAGGWRVEKHPRFLADLTGDKCADIIGFGDAGVWVSLNNGDGTFQTPKKVIDNFAYNVGGWRVEKHPRFLADINGDGRADIIGFGNDFVWVSLNNGDGTFQPIKKVINNFAYNAGGWRVEKHPRFLADLTGDGCADIVGFGNEFVWVSLNNGDGTFQPIKKVINNFAYNAGGWRVEKHPRFLADLTGNKCADVVGFGNAGVWESLNTGNATFQALKRVIDNFGYDAGGWRVEKHPRFVIGPR